VDEDQAPPSVQPMAASDPEDWKTPSARAVAPAWAHSPAHPAGTSRRLPLAHFWCKGCAPIPVLACILVTDGICFDTFI